MKYQVVVHLSTAVDLEIEADSEDEATELAEAYAENSAVELFACQVVKGEFEYEIFDVREAE